MEDRAIWAAEESLWTGDAEDYHRMIDPAALMVVPAEPFILGGEDAADAVSATPRWRQVRLEERRVSRPQEGLIVIAYRAEAEREGETAYVAHCTTTWRRLAHQEWQVVQHQQTPPLRVESPTAAAKTHG